MIAPGWGMRVIEVAGLWGDGCWLAVMKLLVRLTGLTDAVPALPSTPGGAALTLVDGEEVEEAEVTMVLAGGEAYTQQDKFTGRGSTGAFSEEGMEGRERDRVRGLCARIASGIGTIMGVRGAGSQLPFIPSRLPSPCMARVTGQSLC